MCASGVVFDKFCKQLAFRIEDSFFAVCEKIFQQIFTYYLYLYILRRIYFLTVSESNSF